MAVCAPRIVPEDLPECVADGATPEQVAQAIDIALELFDAATRWAFPGVCVDVVRPCLPTMCEQTCGPACQTCGGPRGSGGTSCGCRCGGRGRCRTAPAVRLPHPAREVIRVTIDGVDLPPTQWRHDTPDTVIRVDGLPWPPQDLDKPAGAPGTWEIQYEYGAPLPAAARRALASMIREIAKGICGRPCQLPAGMRLREVNGVAVPEFDSYRQNMLTGYPLVDDWITLARGGHTYKAPTVRLVRRHCP